jgi:putative tryptophan/tyrosine transport system substrate-binding protein
VTRERADALIIVQGSFTSAYRIQLQELAAKNRLPSMCEDSRWTNDGCLVSYGPDLRYQWGRAAVFVDKILKGVKPAHLPVEQPTKFELVINLKTVKEDQRDNSAIGAVPGG